MSKAYEIEEAKHHGELAARNAKVAVDKVRVTRDEMIYRLTHLENLVATQQQQIVQLHQKVALLLTKNFNGKSTVDE